MTQQEPAAPAASKHVSWGKRLGHWSRMAICLLTIGFVYPGAFTEEVNLAELQRKHEGDLYKKE